jgi:hypothetical protein
MEKKKEMYIIGDLRERVSFKRKWRRHSRPHTEDYMKLEMGKDSQACSTFPNNYES